jgi:hypothetical protein
MLRAFVELILVSLPPVLFVAYCRSLLVEGSEAKLSEAAQKAIAAESGTISAKDFERLLALTRLCPFDQNDEASLRALCVYHLLLHGLCGTSSRMCDAFVGWAERERQRCCHFVAVKFDRRIANACACWSDQTSSSEKQSLPPSS